MGFSSGPVNPHGVSAVTSGRRCALALWFTKEKPYRDMVSIIIMSHRADLLVRLDFSPSVIMLVAVVTTMDTMSSWTMMQMWWLLLMLWHLHFPVCHCSRPVYQLHLTSVWTNLIQELQSDRSPCYVCQGISHLFITFGRKTKKRNEEKSLISQIKLNSFQLF